MEGLSLRRCLVHDEESFIYCETCKRVTCSKCRECKRHKLIGIKKLLDKYEDDLTLDSLRQYENELPRLLDSIKLDIGKSKEELRKEDVNIKKKREIVAHSRESEENDLTLMEEAISYLRKVQLKASTDRLQRSCEKAIHELDIQEEIKDEIRGYSGGLEELEEALEEGKRRLKVLEEERYLLERVRSEETEEEKLALVLYLEKRGQGYKINCSIPEFRAMEGVEGVFDIDGVMEKKLINVGKGIMISEPVIVKKGLRVGGNNFYASLSHQGILAIYSATMDNPRNYTYKQGDGMNIIQFTNLRNGEQVEVEVEDESTIAFYDDKMILLTRNKPLREARVERVFDEQNIPVFKRIGNVNRVDPYTDTFLLHSRRILCYRSTYNIPYEFNLDTRVNMRIEIEQKVFAFSSSMGIDCGVKAVFQGNDNKFIYTLDGDDEVTLLHDVREEWHLRSLFVSSNHPKDLSKCVLKYSSYLVKEGNKIDPRRPIYFESNQSVIRVYKDIFLLYDMNTNKWVLCRIIIP